MHIHPVTWLPQPVYSNFSQIKVIKSYRQVLFDVAGYTGSPGFGQSCFGKGKRLFRDFPPETPYVIFQGIYSTKRRRQWKTKPGFYLNKNTLRTADHVFTNKTVDQINLQRLLPLDRITYVAPGIIPSEFTFDGSARDDMRRKWQIGDERVIFSAAMFRPDVKTEGLSWVIRACGELFRQGNQFWLVIAGDGKEKKKLQKMAAEQVPGRVLFVGKIPRRDMYRY